MKKNFECAKKLFCRYNNKCFDDGRFWMGGFINPLHWDEEFLDTLFLMINHNMKDVWVGFIAGTRKKFEVIFQ